MRVLAGDREVRRTSCCRSSRRSRPPSVTRPRSGSRKRSSRFVTVVLPAPLGPTSATRRPGSSRRSKPVDAGALPRRVGGGHALERDAGRPAGRRRVRIPDRRLALDQIEHPPTGGDRGGELARRAGSGGRSRTTPVRAAPASPRGRGRGPARAPTRREHPGDRQARDRIESPRRGRGERVAACRGGRARGRVRDAAERVLLAPVDDELGRAAQHLDELGRQLAARSRLPAAATRASRAASTGTSDAGEQEAERRARSGGRQERRGRRDARRPDHECDEQRRRARGGRAPAARRRRRPSGRAVAAPIARELPGRERLDPLVEARRIRPSARQRESCETSRSSVAGERPREPEETHEDDRHRQREDRRPLGCARDQVAGRRDQRRRRTRPRARRARPRARRGARGIPEKASSRRSVAVMRRPPRLDDPAVFSRTTRSACAASSGRWAISSTVRPAPQPLDRLADELRARGSRFGGRLVQDRRARRRGGTRARARSAALSRPRAAARPRRRRVS